MATTTDLAAEFRASTYFKWWQKLLRNEREAHLRIVPTTERESAMRDGAVAVLTRLLSAPDVLVHVEKSQREDQRRFDPVGFAADYDDDAETVN